MTASASPQADIPRDLRCDASRPSWDRRSARAASPAINGHRTRFGRVGRLMRRVQGAAVIVTPRRTRRRHNDSNRSHSYLAASPVPPSRVPSSASDPRPSCYPAVRARMCQATGGSGCGPPGVSALVAAVRSPRRQPASGQERGSCGKPPLSRQQSAPPGRYALPPRYAHADKVADRLASSRPARRWVLAGKIPTISQRRIVADVRPITVAIAQTG